MRLALKVIYDVRTKSHVADAKRKTYSVEYQKFLLQMETSYTR